MLLPHWFSWQLEINQIFYISNETLTTWWIAELKGEANPNVSADDRNEMELHFALESKCELGIVLKLQLYHWNPAHFRSVSPFLLSSCQPHLNLFHSHLVQSLNFHERNKKWEIKKHAGFYMHVCACECTIRERTKHLAKADNSQYFDRSHTCMNMIRCSWADSQAAAECAADGEAWMTQLMPINQWIANTSTSSDLIELTTCLISCQANVLSSVFMITSPLAAFGAWCLDFWDISP